MDRSDRYSESDAFFFDVFVVSLVSPLFLFLSLSLSQLFDVLNFHELCPGFSAAGFQKPQTDPVIFTHQLWIGLTRPARDNLTLIEINGNDLNDVWHFRPSSWLLGKSIRDCATSLVLSLRGGKFEGLNIWSIVAFRQLGNSTFSSRVIVFLSTRAAFYRGFIVTSAKEK